MKAVFIIVSILVGQMSWAAGPVSQCGGTDVLEQKSDAITRVIFAQNYPKFDQDQIQGDGVATPRNWYDAKNEVFHFYRGVIVRGLPPTKEAVFELKFDVKGGNCILEAVQMIEPL